MQETIAKLSAGEKPTAPGEVNVREANIWPESVKPPEAIRQLKIVVMGAGSAGIGVANALRSAMVSAGASEAEATSNFYVLDKDGLVGAARESGLGEDVMRFARSDLADKLPLEEVVKQVQVRTVPGVLVGSAASSSRTTDFPDPYKRTPEDFS